MSNYDYNVDSFLLKEGQEKAIVCSETFDNYPDAMTYYKDARSALTSELETGKVKAWFITLSRIYMKGTTLRHENMKHEGTI
jgi:hypothetical protein